MERSANDFKSAFSLKNNVPFTGMAGYNVYDKDYNLSYDTLTDKKYAMASAESSYEITFEWFNIESATTLTAGIFAVWTLFI